jgi:hypothetical protein
VTRPEEATMKEWLQGQNSSEELWVTVWFVAVVVVGVLIWSYETYIRH